MKQIILLLLIGTAAIGQNNASFVQVSETDENGLPVIAGFLDETEFMNAINDICNDVTLTEEDFDGGPVDITVCGPVISASGDSFFTAGEIEEGFSLFGSNETDLILYPEFQSIPTLIGSTTSEEFMTFSFENDDVFLATL